MILNVDIARREWTARLKEQARQLRVVAIAAETDAMREELSDYADRIERQTYRLIREIDGHLVIKDFSTIKDVRDPGVKNF